MILHMVHYATGCSEVAFLRWRRIVLILSLAKNNWILRHCCPVELFVDQEFDKDTIRNWTAENRFSLVPVPARRHHKAGAVERKNRVLQDALEIFDQDAEYKKLQVPDRLQAACFVSNLLYGSRILPAFEMA